MSSEDPLHDQLAEELEASGRPPLGDLVNRSVAEGQRTRRRRTTTGAGLGIVGVLGVAAAVQFVPSARQTTVQNVGAGAGAATPSSSPTTVTPTTTSALTATPVGSPSSTPPALAKPPVRIVAPGKLDLGNGMSLTLTWDSVVTSANGGSVGPIYTDNGNQGQNSIGFQEADNLVSGLYIGGGSAASAVLTLGGQSYAGTVVTLAGHPGWCEVYAIVPNVPASPTAPPPTSSSPPGGMVAGNWTVYDAQGNVLASSNAPLH